MRYKIEYGIIKSSIWINAPYDTKSDAKEARFRGVTHNCELCTDIVCNKGKAETVVYSGEQRLWIEE